MNGVIFLEWKNQNIIMANTDQCKKMMNDINEIIKYSKLSKRKFALYYEIPYRTIINWTSKKEQQTYRKCPHYVLKLLEKAVKIDFAKN